MVRREILLAIDQYRIASQGEWPTPRALAELIGPTHGLLSLLLEMVAAGLVQVVDGRVMTTGGER